MKIRTLKSKRRRQSPAAPNGARTGSTKRGIALIAVISFTVIITILGFSLLTLAEGEILLAQKDINRTKAFYLAEAGISKLAARLYNNELDSIDETAMGEGIYRVDVCLDDKGAPAYAISTGTVRGQEKRIKVEVSCLAAPYEKAVYAGNLDEEPWVFPLRGKGVPKLSGGFTAREIGGRDIINGNIYINGDVALYEESSVNPSPLPNTYGLNGDVDATGGIYTDPNASISGDRNESVEPLSSPDLLSMNYSVNNTHNVGQIFADAGIDSGYLPAGHELRDVFVKNPSNRSTECGTTTGNDYFLEPSSGIVRGSPKSGDTPIGIGNDRVYYIDGDLWVHNTATYGFLMNGKATIIVTGNIHICDNLEYADSESLLGLIALGNYNEDSGELENGGNIYFGDPIHGTMYTVSALMFAANNFLYNTNFVTGDAKEPQTGFSVYGNYSALNQVSVYMDWYDDDTTRQGMPAYFNSSTGQWISIKDGLALTSAEINTLRHYQMIVNYDERVRTKDTRPPGLPRGSGTIFSALTHWEELP